MFRNALVLICLFIFIVFGSISYGDEMPLGYWNVKYNPDSSQQYIDMFEELGANFVVIGDHPAYPFVDARIMPIRGIGQIGPYGEIYNTACYSIWQAEDDTSEIKFIHPAGYRGSGADSIYWVAPDSNTFYIFLDELWYRQPNYADTTQDHNNLPYTPMIQIWADVDSSLEDSVLGYLNIYQSEEWWLRPDSLYQDTLAEYPILANTFLDSASNLISYSFSPYERDYGSVTTYQISSTGLATLKVDYLKISNRYGRQIMSGFYDQQIISQLSQALYSPDSLLAWELRDEPTPDMFLPYRYILNLIKQTSLKKTLATNSALPAQICEIK